MHPRKISGMPIIAPISVADKRIPRIRIPIPMKAPMSLPTILRISKASPKISLIGQKRISNSIIVFTFDFF
jgi:hypothetical protein